MRLFISHSRQNSGAALKLCDELNRRQVNAWLDVRELDSGANWNESVAAAVRKADGIIFLLGPPGPRDQWQRFEWEQVMEEEYYLDPNRLLIPIVIGGAEIPGFLSTRKAIHIEASSIDFSGVADAVVEAMSDPSNSVDPEKLKLGQEARSRALSNLQEYSRKLEEEDVKRAGLRAME